MMGLRRTLGRLVLWSVAAVADHSAPDGTEDAARRFLVRLALCPCRNERPAPDLVASRCVPLVRDPRTAA